MTDTSKAEVDRAEPSEALYIALGRLVFDFGQLEEAVRHALLSIFDGADEARMVLMGLSFRQLVERFGVLYAPFRYDGTAESGVAPLCRVLSQLNDERNREIHATWGFWADSGRPVRHRERLRANTGFSMSMESVSPEELLALATRMREASELVWQASLDYERQRIAQRGERDVCQ